MGFPFLFAIPAASTFLLLRYMYRRFISKTINSPDKYLDFQQMCLNYGFQSSKHKVTTNDGYILTIFWIFPKQRWNDQVVFFQHGVTSSADAWICNGPQLAPAFIMANLGYQVWCGNSRGNHYSRSHQQLDPNKDKKFWQFSFIQMGRFDLPAVIDYIRDKSQVEKIHYIGTSQGTSQMFTTLSQGEVNWKSKLKSCTLLGPVCRLNNTTRSRTVLAKLKMSNLVSLIIRRGQYLSRNKLMSYINAFFAEMFPQIPFLFSGRKYNNLQRLPVFISHLPSGASLQCYHHFSQIIRAKKFQYYDYGRRENIKRYGKEHPDQIDISKINQNNSPPLLIGVGTADQVASEKDSEWILEQLSHGKSVKAHFQWPMSHESFSFGRDMTYLKRDVVGFIQRFSGFNGSPKLKEQ